VLVVECSRGDQDDRQVSAKRHHSIQFNSINVFLKWPKLMSPQGPPR